MDKKGPEKSVWFRDQLEKHARRYGSEGCSKCNGLGHIFDPFGGGKDRSAFVLCSCMESAARSTLPPYIYFDDDSNSMKPCPSRPARNAIARMHRLQHRSGIPGRYLWKFISTIDIEKQNGQDITSLLIALDHAVETVHNFGKNERRGLYLYGPTGSGKTLLSCAVLNELIRLYQADVRYAKISRDVLGKLRASFNPNSEFYGEGSRIEEELASVDALVIDDFGVHKETEWVNSVLYDLVDSRYENNRLTIITSNDPMESVREASGGRIYSRLKEMCSEIHMDLPDYRLRSERKY